MKTPSTLSLLLAIAAFSITPVFADLLIYEPFNYSPGSTIVGQTDLVTSATAIWYGAGTAGTGVRHQAIAGSLPGLSFAQGNAGNMKLADNGEMARMNLPSQYSPTTKPGYSLFYSLLLNVPSISGLTVPHSNVNANNDVIIAINNGTGAQVNRPSSWAGELVLRLGNDTNQYNIGVRASTTVASTTFFTGDLATNQTHLVVVQYIAGTALGVGGTNNIWIDPNPTNFGAATVPAPDGVTYGTINGGSTDHADSLLIGAGISAGAVPNDTYIDEIRAGTTWADVTSTNIPVTISSQPRNTRAIIGSQATFSVSTVFANAFQWYHNDSPIANATQNTLTLANIQSADAGTYKVVVGNGTPTLSSSNATLTVFPDVYPRLAPLWSLAPGSRPYLTVDGANAPNQRCIAYNSVSNTVLLVSRTNSTTSSTNPAIYVLNANTAADLYQMNVDPAVISTGVNNNSLSLNYIDVAGDGAVIAGNVGDSTANFNLYYWTNSDSATEPVRVWTGDPSGQGNQRFGDYFAVRGAGASTQVLLDSQAGTFGALLMPTTGHDITEADSWTGDGIGGYGWFANPAGGQAGGRTLLFYGNDATFWEKHGSGNFNLLSYDTVAHTGTIITNYPNVSGSPGQIAVNAVSNVLVGIVFGSSSNLPDTLVQYDISDPSQPLFIKSYDFPANHQDNANGCGRVIFKGDRVFALDSNNGMAAWTLVPLLHITPLPSSGVVLSWSSQTPGYTLKASPSLATPTTWTNVTTGTLVGNQYFATNSATGGALFYRLEK